MKCIICNSDNPLKAKAGSLDMLVCRKCGLEWQPEFPDAEELREIYGKYFLDDVQGRMPEIYDAMKRNGFLRIFNKYIKGYLRHGKPVVLDVGCGAGHFLECIKDTADVFGIDLDCRAVEFAREKLGEDRVKCTSIEDFDTERRFDLITMFDFIEHVESSESVLKKANSLLRDGGLIFINTPNAASLSKRIQGKNWLQYRREHLYCFNPGNMKVLLERSGFEVVRTGSRSKYINLYYLYLHAKAYNLGLMKPLLPVMYLLRGALKRINLSIPAGEFVMLARKRLT